MTATSTLPRESVPLAGRARQRLIALPVEVLALALLAVATRVVYLTSPRSIVFDEVYFRDAALHYKDGTYYFDLHPPLGKLLLGWWGDLIGIDATHSLPAGTAPTASSVDPAVWLRLLPALAGAALIVVFYYFLRNLGAGRKVATLGAGLLLLDNALLVQSRLILIDSMLLLFGMGAITLFLAAQRHTGRSYWFRFGAAAVLAGMAASVKLTGLTALGVIGVVWLADAIRRRGDWRALLRQGAVITLVPVTVYLGTFAIHVAQTPNSGPGNAYMSAPYQATLVPNATYPNPRYDPDARMSLPERFSDLNHAIKRYEHSLNDATHPYSSSWTSWPVMKRGLYYWTNSTKDADGKQRSIYLLGNPVLWWGTLLALTVIATSWIWRPALFRAHRRAFAFLGGAWALSYLPFALIERPMFLYHYFFPLMFSLAAACLGLGVLAGWTEAPASTAARPVARPARPVPDVRAWAFPSRGSQSLFWSILVVAFLTFCWFAPLSYGFPLTDGQLGRRLWFDSWR